MKTNQHRQTRKPGQRVHVVTRSVGRFRKTDYGPRAQPPPKPITMPFRTMTILTDADCGLPEDPIAQLAAETYLTAWIGWQLKNESKAKAVPIQAIKMTVNNESLSIRDVPADVMDGIASELRRISCRSEVYGKRP